MTHMRKISELIWHCSATIEGKDYTVEQIRDWHVRGNGWKDIGYHKVVHLDGSVSEGRPESKVGSHVAGRNTGTIGYCYVGGVDGRMRPKDTRTDAQKRTMERLTREAIERYGLTAVSGHHDYAAKACPCFPAREEYAPLLDGDQAFLPDPAKTAIGIGIVTASRLNLRRAPGGEVLGSMPRGTKVVVNGADGSWLSVTTPFGATGWAARAHIKRT